MNKFIILIILGGICDLALSNQVLCSQHPNPACCCFPCGNLVTSWVVNRNNDVPNSSIMPDGDIPVITSNDGTFQSQEIDNQNLVRPSILNGHSEERDHVKPTTSRNNQRNSDTDNLNQRSNSGYHNTDRITFNEQDLNIRDQDRGGPFRSVHESINIDSGISGNNDAPKSSLNGQEMYVQNVNKQSVLNEHDVGPFEQSDIVKPVTSQNNQHTNNNRYNLHQRRIPGGHNTDRITFNEQDLNIRDQDRGGPFRSAHESINNDSGVPVISQNTQTKQRK